MGAHVSAVHYKTKTFLTKMCEAHLISWSIGDVGLAIVVKHLQTD